MRVKHLIIASFQPKWYSVIFTTMIYWWWGSHYVMGYNYYTDVLNNYTPPLLLYKYVLCLLVCPSTTIWKEQNHIMIIQLMTKTFLFIIHHHSKTRRKFLTVYILQHISWQPSTTCGVNCYYTTCSCQSKNVKLL